MIELGYKEMVKTLNVVPDNTECCSVPHVSEGRRQPVCDRVV